MPLQTLLFWVITEDLVSRFNGLQRKDLSIKGGPGQCYAVFTGWLIDTKMALSMFLPIYLNTRRDGVQDTDSHLQIAHKCRAFYLKF